MSKATRDWRAPVSGQKSSSWLITICTNKQPTPELEKKFDECLQRIFNGLNITSYIDVVRGEPSTIQGLEVKAGVDEISSKNGYLHNHNTVSIKSHDCILQLNFSRIRKTIQEYLSPVGVSNFHLDVKLLGNDVQKAINYANKTVARSKG